MSSQLPGFGFSPYPLPTTLRADSSNFKYTAIPEHSGGGGDDDDARHINNTGGRVLPTFSLFPAADPVPAQGTLSAVHRAQATGNGGRGEHQRAMPVPARARVPVPSHRRRGDPEQELLGGEHQDVQRILHAADGRRLDPDRRARRDDEYTGERFPGGIYK